MNADIRILTQLARVDSDSPAGRTPSTPNSDTNSNDTTNPSTAVIRSANNHLSLIEGENAIAATNSVSPSEEPWATHAANKVSFDAAIRRIEAHERQFEHSILPANEIRVEAGCVIAGGKELSLGVVGFGNLCQRLKAPESFLLDLEPDMRNRLLRHQIRRGRFADKKMSVGKGRLVSRDGWFVDLDRADLITLSGVEILEAIRAGLGETSAALKVETLNLRYDSFQIDLIADRFTGGELGGGIHVNHSFLGRYATRVTTYVIRQVCSNGMIQRECVGSREVARTRRLEDLPHNRAMQIEQVRRLAEEAAKRITPTFESIGSLRIKALKDETAVYRVMEQFLRNARMHSKHMMALLRLAWKHELGGNRELSYYGVLNAFTWLATHSSRIEEAELKTIELTTNHLPSELQTAQLFRLSGVFANQANHLCPECYRVMAA